MYDDDADFKDIHQACTNLDERYNHEYADFLIQEGLLFKGGQLCIPKSSMRDNIIQEKHSGELSDHFGLDKTLELVRRNYFWPKLQKDVRKFVEECTIFQKGKGKSMNAGLYQPLPIPS